MLITLVVLLSLVAATYLFIQQTKFGGTPTGERAARIARSPNFRDGKFQNQTLTPDLTDGATYTQVMKEFFFGKSNRNMPADTIPSVKTNLQTISDSTDVVIWFGHSSFYMQLDGKKFLVDPVFSGAASPLSFTTRSFPGTDVYAANEIPDVDFLLISHDHWDHLDYETVLQLKDRVGKVVTGLGTGEHLEYWGYDQHQIIEGDWNETVEMGEGFTITLTPARHFSGRAFKRNQALWTSFVIETPNRKIYVGGDSGYDRHFSEIGEAHGPFDLAILECGQYNRYWKYTHMMPEETVQAALDLRAERLLPVHWSKFSLAMHDWDEPIIKVTEAAKKRDLRVVHPLIGEVVKLDSTIVYREWWR